MCMLSLVCTHTVEPQKAEKPVQPAKPEKPVSKPPAEEPKTTPHVEGKHALHAVEWFMSTCVSGDLIIVEYHTVNFSSIQTLYIQ